MSDTKEKKRLRKLKAMMSYRKRKGLCALLHRKSKNRRIQVTHDYDGPVKETKLPVCSFSEGEEKCDRPCVPLVKFCMDRILISNHKYGNIKDSSGKIKATFARLREKPKFRVLPIVIAYRI